MGLKFTPVMGSCPLRHSSMFGLWLALLGPIASPNSLNGRFSLPPASQPPTHPLQHAISDITVVLKKVAENPAV